MTREELRVVLGEWFCGCGCREDAAGALLRLLRIHPLYEHQNELTAMLPDLGVKYLVLYMLDRLALTEHGGSVGGAWLTEKGEAVRDALNREAEDEFETLMRPACVHGFDIEDQDHDCMAVDAASHREDT